MPKRVETSIAAHGEESMQDPTPAGKAEPGQHANFLKRERRNGGDVCAGREGNARSEGKELKFDARTCRLSPWTRSERRQTRVGRCRETDAKSRATPWGAIQRPTAAQAKKCETWTTHEFPGPYRLPVRIAKAV